MPEPLSTIWLVVLGAGGYVVLVVQFFKDYLSVRKLELEITQLKKRSTGMSSVIVLATQDEIERYGKRLSEANQKHRRTSGMVVGASLIGVCTVLLVEVEHADRSNVSSVPTIVPEVNTNQSGSKPNIRSPDSQAQAPLVVPHRPPMRTPPSSTSVRPPTPTQQVGRPVRPGPSPVPMPSKPSSSDPITVVPANQPASSASSPTFAASRPTIAASTPTFAASTPASAATP